MARRPYTHYGVRIGRQIGVFTDWSDCAEQVSGYSGQCYRGFHSYREAFNFAYGEPEAPAQLAVEHTFEAAATPEPETVTAPEPEIATIPELVTVAASEPETATTSESAIVMAPEPETALTPEPEITMAPEPTTAITSESATTTAFEPETMPQSRTVLDAEPGHQEPPPAKKARHSEGQATETFSDTQENTFGSSDIVDEAGESSSSAADPSEIVYNDIGQAKERLSALMEGGGAVKIIPVSPKRKWEE
ncbi:hypothetical protein NW754_014877 [Fusarium falciforme]|uniref:Ribonuclease H1 N-terminal domain-containing protein n=1 Tax=Fusarium falciforme TaxID=195108 RepID=A0A9W8UZK8_9HYPO|nr:hypothetical protein NW754_014877 [Fusarium falciforme]KAJ4182228.1 hypothetical protein NW767_013911 [Fusarium falciforme]KAJ4183686.1 hypothetical protein NW755_009721 [Fusarium falciforme]KAJ4238357.1 hypothetical protein NW757_013173 [Fusarium falciforme]